MNHQSVAMMRSAIGTLSLMFLFVLSTSNLVAAPLVPGTGQKIDKVGDDLEGETWEYYRNGAKSSSNIDKRERLPSGVSANDRWYESTYRGQPDIIRRVKTPAGGIEGSKYSLLMRSLHTGIPGKRTNKMQQDDLLINVDAKMGGFMPSRWSPSVVVRVSVPPFKYWEQRSGSSFGFRADVVGPKSRYSKSLEHYWPGMFIQFNRKADGYEKDSAVILVRGDSSGQDLQGPKITKPGWWTLGMSFTPDGVIHYYASEGVDDLTAKDHITSQIPYGSPVYRFHTFFFNIVNMDDGRSWSTPWIIDDPSLYYIPAIARKRSGVTR